MKATAQLGFDKRTRGWSVSLALNLNVQEIGQVGLLHRSNFAACCLLLPAVGREWFNGAIAAAKGVDRIAG
jgi:hypothetical protein